MKPLEAAHNNAHWLLPDTSLTCIICAQAYSELFVVLVIRNIRCNVQ